MSEADLEVKNPGEEYRGVLKGYGARSAEVNIRNETGANLRIVTALKSPTEAVWIPREQPQIGTFANKTAQVWGVAQENDESQPVQATVTLAGLGKPDVEITWGNSGAGEHNCTVTPNERFGGCPVISPTSQDNYAVWDIVLRSPPPICNA